MEGFTHFAIETGIRTFPIQNAINAYRMQLLQMVFQLLFVIYLY
jgi:hypothetical protein